MPDGANGCGVTNAIRRDAIGASAGGRCAAAVASLERDDAVGEGAHLALRRGPACPMVVDRRGHRRHVTELTEHVDEFVDPEARLHLARVPVQRLRWRVAPQHRAERGADHRLAPLRGPGGEGALELLGAHQARQQLQPAPAVVQVSQLRGQAVSIGLAVEQDNVGGTDETCLVIPVPAHQAAGTSVSGTPPAACRLTVRRSARRTKVRPMSMAAATGSPPGMTKPLGSGTRASSPAISAASDSTMAAVTVGKCFTSLGRSAGAVASSAPTVNRSRCSSSRRSARGGSVHRARARPRALIASSSAPYASVCRSSLRTRPPYSRLVSPPSPWRVTMLTPRVPGIAPPAICWPRSWPWWRRRPRW